jgi:FMN phosphatase YigB (HAD superfamily)
MTALVFWIDVDNTLINNDKVKEVLDSSLQVELGKDLTAHFWQLYEQARVERGVVDIPLALRRLREQIPTQVLDEQTYQHVHSLFDNFPFYNELYPYALETLNYLNTLGVTVIVSDGDLDFQAEKIVNSALADTVHGRVLLYTHKQEHVDEITRLYPADHYVMIDDKPQILADIKKLLGPKVTTAFVKQGKYAAEKLPENFTPDMEVDHLGDLCQYDTAAFLGQTHG